MSTGVERSPTISVARQPILDRRGQIFGHELLYRHSPDATSCISGADDVGALMFSDAVLSIGLDVLTSGRPAFINLTHKLLLEGASTLLPPEVAVFEIREDIPADDNVIEQCRQLQSDGYLLALDDFMPDSPAEALLPFARYV